jgi:arsenate reductase (thioredoxin)
VTAQKTVLVLCTGNSCRSQMAEAILNQEFSGHIRALSAGTHPQANIAEHAIEALKLAGVPTAGLYTKDIQAVIDERIDLVVTVCDSAKEICPLFPGPVPIIHQPFHDPHGESLDSFIRVRDEIRGRLVPVVRATLGLEDFPAHDDKAETGT